MNRAGSTSAHFSRFSRGAAPWLTLLGLLFFGAPTIAIAQVQTPSGGQLLQQLTLPPPPAPADKPALSIDSPTTAPATSTTPLPIKVIRITGNTLLSTKQLHALVASAEGQTLTLAQLQSLADRITQLYRKHGYRLARAYVPAQSIVNGEVTIAVLEARYGQITLNNSSTTSERPLNATLAPLASGAPVSDGPLNRSLLLLSDVPGVTVDSTLRPGARTGTSDLQVDVTSAARFSGLVAVDNFGNRYTGRARGTALLNVNSLLHEGDKLDANVLSSGSGMSYGELGYHYLLNGQGTVLGVSSSYLHYELSGALSDLQAHGRAQVDSVNLTHPIIRGTAGNLYAHVQFDHRLLHDDIDVASIRSDRHTNGWSAVLAGDRRDDYGVTNFNASVIVDQVVFDDAAARISDRIGADTQGTGTHYDFTLARLQQLDRTNSLYFAFTGQLADRNLDPSDQFSLGGPSNTRGYDVGAVTGADGNVITAELRHAFDFPVAWLGGLFADRGHIEVYRNTFTPGTNVATLSDAGVSLHWDGPHEWAVTTQVAARIGALPPLLRSAARESVWLQVQKGL